VDVGAHSQRRSGVAGCGARSHQLRTHSGDNVIMNDATALGERRLTLDFSQISTIIARAIRTDHHKEADPGYGVAEGQASARNLVEALRAAQPVDPPASEKSLLRPRRPCAVTREVPKKFTPRNV
jgi:hypothetical protein